MCLFLYIKNGISDLLDLAEAVLAKMFTKYTANVIRLQYNRTVELTDSVE